jgi:uncharacterized membrane protein
MVWREQVVGPLERQGWLDQVADAVSRAVEPLLRRPEAERGIEVLRGGWLGHPLHPALTGLPLGLWTGSVLLDLVCESKAAGVVSAAGTLSAGAAGAAGFADWTATEGRDRRLGVVHGALNVSGLGLQLISLGARLRRRRLRAFSYSLLGLSVSAAAAWLGGELVYGSPVTLD